MKIKADCTQINTPEWNGFADAQAWFNDPDGDCISNDWIIYIENHIHNTTTTVTPWQWSQTAPGSNGYYDFGNQNWNCCHGEISGEGSGIDPNCSCDWSYTGGVIHIDCSPCFGL